MEGVPNCWMFPDFHKNEDKLWMAIINKNERKSKKSVLVFSFRPLYYSLCISKIPEVGSVL